MRGCGAAADVRGRRAGCGIAPPHTALDSSEISNEADFLTDLVVGADREGRSGEYAQAYARSALKTRMDAVADRNAKVCSPLSLPLFPLMVAMRCRLLWCSTMHLLQLA